MVLEVLGQAELASNNTEGAIRDFTRLSEIQPGSPQAHYLLAKAYAMARGVSPVRQSLNRSVAKGALQHALALDPHHREANLGLLYLEALDEDYPAAQRGLATLKAQHDRHPEVAEAEAWLALKQGQTDHAMQIYRAAQQRFPAANVWPIKEAALTMSKGDHKAGIARLKSWLGKHPDDVQVRFWLANAYLLAGQEAPAREAFERVLARQSGNSLVLITLPGYCATRSRPGR
jgi:predicted Zn-dependent protease